MFIEETTKDPITIITPQYSSIVKNRPEMMKLKIRVLGHLFEIMLQISGNPLKAVKLIYQIRKKYQSIFGESLLTKAAKVDNRYYWRLGTPGFPSKAIDKMHEYETERFFTSQANGLRTLILAITNKCPLNCEHCFEWDNLNHQDQLSTPDLIHLVHKYQDYGTTQIMFTGGEPMLRINDIYEILSASKHGTDFWIITSGLGLNKDRALKLKKSGLTGVMVSLDHEDATRHDRFRGYKGAYEMAIQSVINAKKAGIVTALSFCAVKNSVNQDHLNNYMKLANDLGVSFVQFLDPRSSGRYSEKNVELGKEEIDLLEKIYIEYNTSKEYKDYPIINYLGFHQRRVGCFGAGNRFFYIDTDGDAHICPYCIKKVANTLQHSAEEIIDMLAKNSCFVFEKNSLL